MKNTTNWLICSDMVWCGEVRIINATTENSDLKHFGKNLFLTARKLLIIPGRRQPKTSICQNGTLKNLLNLFAFQVVLTADKNGNSTWWRNSLIRNQSSCSSRGWREVVVGVGVVRFYITRHGSRSANCAKWQRIYW